MAIAGYRVMVFPPALARGNRPQVCFTHPANVQNKWYMLCARVSRAACLPQPDWAHKYGGEFTRRTLR